MPRRQWNDGMEILFQDLSSNSSSLEMELYDRVIYELMGRQQNVIFRGGFNVTYVNGTTVSVAAGVGMYFDGTQVDPEPQHRLLYAAAAQNVVISAADPTNPRIDLICIAAGANTGRATVSTENRNYKDPNTGVVSSTSQIVETDWQSSMLVVAGTPAGSPVAPATPAGYILLAQVLVTAVSGILSQSAITDKRPRYQSAFSWGELVEIETANYTLDLDDELIIMNPVANATVTLPAASLCSGKRWTIKNISAFQITLQCQGADTIDGQPSQVIANQYTAVTIRGSASGFYLT